MATTTNKGYELIVTGTEEDTWGDTLNSDVFEIIDENLGGLVTKSLTNVQVDLNAAESRALRLILTGTLTGNVLVTTQAIGMTVVENNCTGNFTVTFQKNGVGSAVTLPNGSKNLVMTGASGDPSLIGVEFPSGTRMLFQQTTPPAGWTKDTTTTDLDNSAIRLTTGTVGSGGSLNFTDAMASRALSGSVAGHTLTTAQIPLHGHPARYSTSVDNDEQAEGGIMLSNKPGQKQNVAAYTGTLGDTLGQQIGGTGGGEAHNHGLSMTNLNMAVRYFDTVVGVKQ